MKIAMYQVDAFTDHVFGGNPAAVCVLGAWLTDETMQKIALENNLSETAFLVETEKGYDIRWFTPKFEIDLAGHPTLASAHVVFHCLKSGLKKVRFESPSGALFVSEDQGLISLDFPSRPGEPCAVPPQLVKGLGAEPAELYLARDHLAVFESEDDILALEPDFLALRGMESLGVIATAPGKEVDFVSRFFAPRLALEDPVTGSAHCTLIPYWAKRLDKAELSARQLSERVGVLSCQDRGERVTIAGKAVLYMEGHIFV